MILPSLKSIFFPRFSIFPPVKACDLLSYEQAAKPKPIQNNKQKYSPENNLNEMTYVRRPCTCVFVCACVRTLTFFFIKFIYRTTNIPTARFDVPTVVNCDERCITEYHCL